MKRMSPWQAMKTEKLGMNQLSKMAKTGLDSLPEMKSGKLEQMEPLGGRPRGDLGNPARPRSVGHVAGNLPTSLLHLMKGNR